MGDYKINENKTAQIVKNITFITVISSIFIFIISLILIKFFNINIFLFSILSLIVLMGVSIILNVISWGLSTLDKDTKEFIGNIRNKLKEAKTYNEHLVIKHELIDECIDDKGLIRLPFPLTIKNLINEINGKLDLLKKIEENE